MTIKEIIEQFDTDSRRGFDEHDISSALRKLVPEDKSQIDDTLKAELMAFDFAVDILEQADPSKLNQI